MRVYTVESITEADYGCEETNREEPMALLKLVPVVSSQEESNQDESDRIVRRVEVAESILAQQGISEGKQVCISGNGSIQRYLRVVAAVIQDREHHGGKIFATARGYGEHKGWWEFPGGKIEAEETPQEALKREILEELSVTIKVGSLIKTVEYDYPGFHLSMDCFWAEVIEGHIELQEAADARWLSEEEYDSVEWLPADKALIDYIRNRETIMYGS